MDPQIYMDTEVYKAAKLGDVALLRRLVKEDFSRLLRVTPQENTTIHVSVSFGHIDFLKEVYDVLLQNNSSLEGDTDYSRSLSFLTQVNSRGDTALHVAAREGHASIAEFLIENILSWPSDHDVESGNNPDTRNRAIESAREKIRMRNKSKYTALHEAVRRNDLEMVKLLIRADPNLGHPNYDADGEDGESLLYLAARDGRLDILKKILDVCPFAAHGGPNDRTALHVAVVEGHLDVVKIILQKQVGLVNEVDKERRSALHYAASKTYTHKIAQELVKSKRCNVYQKDKDGLSALHVAALNSSIPTFRELIQHCPISGELLDNNGRNVVHFAVMSGNIQKIMFALKLPELKELISQPDNDGNTPFHFVVQQNHLNLFGSFLTNRRVDLKAMNHQGHTAADMFDTSSQQLSLVGKIHTFFFMKMTGWPSCAPKGEEKWTIRGANEQQIGNMRDIETEKSKVIPRKEKVCTETNKHEERVAAAARSAEKEMGQTIQLVASLIATVTFVAVFQIPGGYNNDTREPTFLYDDSFKNFLLFDSLAMALSVISLLILLLASLSGYRRYSSCLIAATIILLMAIVCTLLAFVAGFKAVLPDCRRRSHPAACSIDWFKTPLTFKLSFIIQLFNTVDIFDVVIPLIACIIIGPYIISVIQIRYAKFKGFIERRLK